MLLTTSTTTTLIQASIFACLDYYSSLLSSTSHYIPTLYSAHRVRVSSSHSHTRALQGQGLCLTPQYMYTK